MQFLKPIKKYITATPSRLFWAFALTHLFLWALIPSLVNQNLPLDVIEGYAWGNEWLIGTHKHPPMQAWVLELCYMLTGHARWAPYLASQLAIIAAFWAVWQTGRRIAGENAALIGTMLLEGVIYYNFTSPEFNPNVLQLPFWALAGWSFHKAVKEDRLIDWLLFGVWAAGGMYSKYSSGLFLMTLGAVMLAHRDGRQRFKSPGPYLAVLTGFMLFLPHLLWLIHNDWIPFEYTQGRLERYASHYSTIITTTMMVAGQVIALMFLLLMMVFLYDSRSAPSRAPVASFDRIFLTLGSFVPFGLIFCLSLIFGYHIRDMWQTPFWNFIGLWAVVMLRPSLSGSDMRRFGAAWAVVFFIGLFVFAACETLTPYLKEKPRRTIFPGKNLSQHIVDGWHARYHTPLKYVLGDTWPAGNVAWYADDRPHVVMDCDFRISPWINRDDLKKEGGVAVWCIRCADRIASNNEPPDYFMQMFPNAQKQEPITLPRLTSANVPPATLGWLIIPPQTAAVP